MVVHQRFVTYQHFFIVDGSTDTFPLNTSKSVGSDNEAPILSAYISIALARGGWNGFPLMPLIAPILFQ
jgi:hypothetical protein